VVAVGPDLTAAPENTVDGLREADSEPLHRAAERLVRFDHQVNVIRLYREVHDAERVRGSGRKRAAHGPEYCACSERWQAGYRPHRDMYGVAMGRGLDDSGEARPVSFRLACGRHRGAALPKNET
jgi:hypothetical protein